MSKLRKVERLQEIAASNQAHAVANQRVKFRAVETAFENLAGLVEDYATGEAAQTSPQSLQIHRRFFGELYKTYRAQAATLAEQRHQLELRIDELGARHRKLKLLQGVLAKRDRVHAREARKKAEKAQIYRAPSKLS